MVTSKGNDRRMSSRRAAGGNQTEPAFSGRDKPHEFPAKEKDAWWHGVESVDPRS
jgi:hypothetical protein